MKRKKNVNKKEEQHRGKRFGMSRSKISGRHASRMILLGWHLRGQHGTIQTRFGLTLIFFVFPEKGKNNHKCLILPEPLQSSGKRGKTLKKARSSLKGRKQGNPWHHIKAKSGNLSLFSAF